VIKWPEAACCCSSPGRGGAWLPRDARRRAGIALGLPAVVLTGFTLATPKDVGLRYLLPALALWAAAAGCGLVAAVSAARGARGKQLARAVVAVLLGAAVLSTAWSFPDSIAWTAWPFRPNYAVATDSNVDWGQGLGVLRTWSASRDPWWPISGPRITTADIPGARPLLGTAPAHSMAGSPCR